jgi:LasA protease
VRAGDRLGHPSCEGGFSNSTHLHIARTYNGRWVAADGSIPFVFSGWVSQGLGREYDGLLVRGDSVKEACECREEWNAITAD